LSTAAATYTLSLHDALPIYSWPTNTLLGYRGVGASNSGGTNNGTALPNSYDRDPNGTWVNYSQAQQNCSGQTNALGPLGTFWYGDRKSTRLNSSHVKISYAV